MLKLPACMDCVSRFFLHKTPAGPITSSTDLSSPVPTSTHPTGPDLPTAIVVAAAIIAGTVVLLILFIMCSLIFFSWRKNREQSLRRRRNSILSDMHTTSFPNPIELTYSQVQKSSPVNRKKQTTHHKPGTPASKGSPNTKNQLPEPREILAYRDVDMDRFRPQPPPPPSLAANYGVMLYDIPEAMYDEDGQMVFTGGQSSPRVHGKATHNPHDEVDRGQNVPKRNLRSQSVRTHDHDKERVFVAPPPLQRTSSLKSQQASSFDQVYQEQLEPSMLYGARIPEHNTRPLPYGPIYDVPKPLKSAEDVLNIMPENVVEIRELGMGRFGMVSLAATVGLSFKDIRLGENDDKNRSLLVAIKKLSPEGGNPLRESFEKEIKYMSRLHHPNVVQLLGVCMISVPFIMMEYMENGDLTEFLQKQILVDDSVNLLQQNEVSPLVLLYITVQIASGMRYLASQRVVHRDIATRNCLVGRDFVVKISDFGMSRKLYEALYYRVHGKLILPIRWMAYESFYGKFSVKSDVWAFGITMWEIYSLARYEPYHDMTDEELIGDAMKGDRRQRPPRPAIVPDTIYDVMLRCWVHDPFMRGDFEEVYSRLFLAYTQMCQQCK